MIIYKLSYFFDSLPKNYKITVIKYLGNVVKTIKTEYWAVVGYVNSFLLDVINF